jgi:hypothetical protein
LLQKKQEHYKESTDFVATTPIMKRFKKSGKKYVMFLENILTKYGKSLSLQATILNTLKSIKRRKQ